MDDFSNQTYVQFLVVIVSSLCAGVKLLKVEVNCIEDDKQLSWRAVRINRSVIKSRGELSSLTGIIGVTKRCEVIMKGQNV